VTQAQDNKAGERLLSAVERLLDDTDNIIARVETFKGRITHSNDEAVIRAEVARELIAEYSNKAAVSGGAAAAPALFPGIGTVLALTGGNLVDMALMLKFEVELSLALCWLYGMDVRQRKQRQIAFLLASVHTHDVSNKRPYFADVMDAEAVAIWNYAPRQVSKLLLTALTRIALAGLGKSLARGLPFVGILVGGAVNKTLTGRVGRAIVTALEGRDLAEDRDPGEELVDAQLEPEPTPEPEPEPTPEPEPAPEPPKPKAKPKAAPRKRAPAKKKATTRKGGATSKKRAAKKEEESS
jgi:hypothetical protein